MRIQLPPILRSLTRLTWLLATFTVVNAFGQEAETKLQQALRIRIINPGLEFEQPISRKATITANGGVGIRGTYKNLSLTTGSAPIYFGAPYGDVSYKHIYNQAARASKGKTVAGNSGNYWGARLQANFKAIHTDGLIRYADTDFAWGPRWGIQRTFRKLYLLFDLGPVYYFDTEGNHGLFPLTLQLNLGYQVKVW